MASAALIGLAAPLGWVAWLAAVRLSVREPPTAWRMVGSAMALAAAARVVAPQSSPVAASVLGWALLTLAAVDVTDFRLPDVLTLPLTGVGLAFAAAGLGGSADVPNWAPTLLLDRLVGAGGGYLAFAALAAIYRMRRGKDGLGMGDAKLAAAAGAWLGWAALPTVVLLACALAFAWVGVRYLRRGRAVLNEPIAFGAPLALATWVCWLADTPR